MGAPSAEDLGRAIRTAYKAAGISQKDIAEALRRDQTTVSAWVNGENWPPIYALPVIDELCGKPRGHILRLAGGYIDDGSVDVIAAIMQDPDLDDEHGPALVDVYKTFRTLSSP